jgi:hypothetical protein
MALDAGTTNRSARRAGVLGQLGMPGRASLVLKY